jgi:hypothetical protein
VKYLTFLFTGRATHSRADSVGPPSSSAPSEQQDERDFDWEDCEGDHDDRGDGDGGRAAEDPISRLFEMIPEFSAEELETLLHDMPIPDECEVPGLTVGEAIEVCHFQYVM